VKGIMSGVVGAVIGFIAAILAIFIQHQNNIDLWEQQERFQYQKFLFENRIQLFERFQKVITSPEQDYLRKNEFTCSDVKCEKHIVELRTAIALIKEFFPNSPKKLIDKKVATGNIDPIRFGREFLYEISNSMSNEFNYKLYGFGFSDDGK